ncbi:HNH endonuclease signature motif containing protein [Brevibacterium sp. UCMA 11754]|uniref:HNH endonuclease signature motif containing protein n=1 Tax=Brevibacterium sp. UCMA 11754 TaxID=2749198 RepID=UPI001F2ABDBA|nr:HNH endonuclease signature motif containing protein [Brevibacterium sp. UCMA 11754]MCF2571248.1 HNH endonuclease [Brevibacterium sp. UCMA 11754]
MKSTAETHDGQRSERSKNPDSAGKGAGTSADESASSRYSVRYESSVTNLGSASAEYDRAQLKVFELSAGVILEQVIQHHGADVPEGDDPYTFATIAGSVDRCPEPSEEERVREANLRMTVSDLAWNSRPPEEFDLDEPCTELVLVVDTPTTVMVYDAEFAQNVRTPKVEPEPEAPEPPDFPGFEPDTDFSRWIHDNVFTEDLVEISAIFGTSTPRTYRRLTAAMTLIHGLPRFADRVRGGEFTQAHVDAAADLCQTVAMRFLPRLDEYLSVRRADVTSEYFRTALRKKIQLLEPAEDRAETAARRRRVDVDTFKDGTACMTLTGPAAEVHASFQRIQAMARAIHTGQANTFNLAPGIEVIDERTISNLMFDIATRPQPKLSIRVKRIDPVTGILGTTESSLLDDRGNPLFDFDDQGVSGLTDCAKGAAGSSPMGTAFSQASPTQEEITEYDVTVGMPTDQWWIANQAAVVVTVPYLTLTGESDLPGTLADGSPVPAETARRIGARSKTLTRILTDPATGTPIDAKATTYRIPNDVRRTLIAKWAICTVPGCSRRAEKSEIDHVTPFDHDHPDQGGLTRFSNLHCLCKKHHAVKTARNYSVRMPESGLVEYEFSHGVTATVAAPDQPVDAAQAIEFYALTGISARKWRFPKDKVPPPPYVLELMPGETAIRERDEARQREQAIADHQRHLQESYDLAKAKRRQLMIDRMSDWQNAVFQRCLPPGTNPVTMKRLPRGRRRNQAYYRARKTADHRTSKVEYVRIKKAWQEARVQWEHDLAKDPPPF